MFLRDLWYFALPAEALKPGGLTHKTLLGEPVLLGRMPGGEPFAIGDICPHRGVPLSAGTIRRAGADGLGEPTVECPYHGWRFKKDGRCALIPSLVEGQTVDVEKIRVASYPVRERDGNLWIYLPSDKVAGDGAAGTEPPSIPGFEGKAPAIRERMAFGCHVDHAVIGLMDPAHGPFVHQAWWWRSSRSIHEKAKKFAPSELGFTMVAHKPSSNSAGYRVLGGTPETEIAFRLPGVRIERINAGRFRIVGLTTVTPIDEGRTEITQSFYWNSGLLTVLKPLFRPFMRAFLGQDRDMVDLQQKGLRFEPKLMLINDADVQAKWYFRLKDAWASAQDEGRPFQNPVKETTLKWRS